MSIADVLIPRRGPGRPPLPSGVEAAPPIATKLADAREDLIVVDGEYREAAFASARGDDGASEALAAVKVRRAAMVERIADLETAHAAALNADQRMLAAQRAALRSTTVAGIKRNLLAQDSAATDFEAAFAEATRAFNAMLEAGQKAKQGLAALQFTDVALVELNEVVDVVAFELFRQAGAPTDFDSRRASGRLASFPGARVGDARLLDNPGAVPPLAETLRKRTERVMRTLQGR